MSEHRVRVCSGSLERQKLTYLLITCLCIRHALICECSQMLSWTVACCIVSAINNLRLSTCCRRNTWCEISQRRDDNAALAAYIGWRHSLDLWKTLPRLLWSMWSVHGWPDIIAAVTSRGPLQQAVLIPSLILYMGLSNRFAVLTSSNTSFPSSPLPLLTDQSGSLRGREVKRNDAMFFCTTSSTLSTRTNWCKLVFPHIIALWSRTLWFEASEGVCKFCSVAIGGNSVQRGHCDGRVTVLTPTSAISVKKILLLTSAKHKPMTSAVCVHAEEGWYFVFNQVIRRNWKFEMYC